VAGQDVLAEQFESHRGHLRAVAFRMLGSLTEADDAVQEAWLRLSCSDAGGVQNLGGWLTTVVGRVCLDMLRSRGSRREELLDGEPPGPAAGWDNRVDPEQAAVLADSVGLGLLVVLETLEPAERLAFVLHDMFGLPFDEVAPVVGRTPTAARQLASRARRRVRGGAAVPDPDLARRRQVVDAFLAASRGGGFDALLAVLDPDVVLRIDASAVPAGATRLIRGAPAVARQALLFSSRSRFTRPALIDGAVGLVVAPLGRLRLALGLTIVRGKITEIDIIADPERLDQLDLAVLDD
jgi:RNA polymerase sigma factor (sigma-70 family)